MIAWFEVSVIEMERANRFYETILAVFIALNEFEGFKMGWFPDTNKPTQ